MQHRDTFSGYHPVINLFYFVLVLAFAMVLMHPVCLGISLAAALCCTRTLGGKKAVRGSLLLLLPMAVLAAAVNVLFNHEGATILAYFPSGNPLTLESILYGVSAAVMLSALVLWFLCFSQVMTSDKLVYLFGRIIPALSLVISMTLRFVPKFKAQFKVVADAQKCAGRPIDEGKTITRIKNAVTVFSIMVTWSLENGIETADSMKSRGYGLPGRSAFSIFTFDKRDKKALLWLTFCAVTMIYGTASGGFAWQFYPVMRGRPVDAVVVFLYLIDLALGMTPVFLHWQEERNWKKLQEAKA